jgi:hypothetical protein
MGVESVSVRRDGVLTTLANVIVAPQAAFESIRERPQWFVAFVVVSVLFTVADYLMTPATVHVTMAQLARDPNIANLPADQAKSAIDMTAAIVRFSWLASPFIVLLYGLYSALILLIVTTISKGSGGFGRLFALVMNVGIVSLGITYIVTAAIVAVRGPESFSTSADMAAAVPSLAWLASGAPTKLLTFLAAVNPFTVWSFVLLGLGTATVARVSRGIGYLAAALVMLTGIAITVIAAK